MTDEKQPSAEAMEFAEWIGNTIFVRDRWRELVATKIDTFAARSRWQKIKTAPKNTAVLVFAAPFVFTAKQVNYTWYALIGDEVPGSDDASVLLHEVTRWGSPTHWQPFPSPPEPPSCP